MKYSDIDYVTRKLKEQGFKLMDSVVSINTGEQKHRVVYRCNPDMGDYDRILELSWQGESLISVFATRDKNEQSMTHKPPAHVLDYLLLEEIDNGFSKYDERLTR